MNTINEVLIGHCAVDSGQIMLVDPCYVTDNAFVGMDTEPFAADLPKPYPFSYNGACSASCSEESAGQIGRGTAVVASSGYGDGRYPVYATYVDAGEFGTRVASVRIEFIAPAEGDDDYEDGE